MSPFVCINHRPSFSATSAKYLRLLDHDFSLCFACVRVCVSDCLFSFVSYACMRVRLGCVRSPAKISFQETETRSTAYT